MNPVEWHNHISSRFEVYFNGRLPAREELGDEDMSVAAVSAGYPTYASDEWDPNHGIHRARIDYPKPRQGSSSWCASANNQHQWAGVGLVTPKMVTAVQT